MLSGNPLLQEEVFGPVAILVAVEDNRQLAAALESLQGQLTATLLADEDDHADAAPLAQRLVHKAGECCSTGIPPG
ncbi:NADP-dependent fatty aldehyde dehydrogenase [Serratia plymuthica]|uniref:NADP-dependent fatty aldehyde dehydrogenase n=1 Tax=Serratia plymuthica TaxID=82996 RepID=A0A2X4XJK5_SERPL|nr:NADP-dependent fatty aldehyde dehydrogenase [Serratia plymuthica]